MEGGKKFYLTFAYPTTSGALHVGHARSYTLPDIMAKYRMMAGRDVFFPIGFHATGGDVVKIFNLIKEDAANAALYGINKDTLGKLDSPERLEKEFERIYLGLFKEAGFSLDYGTRVATIDPQYNRFIQWQFRKLREKGYLVQKDYRIAWCPKEEQPVNLDAAEADIKEWNGAKIKDYTAIKFGDNPKFLVSTLRPETIFGVTNIWMNPDTDYVEAEVDGEKQVFSKSTLIKLRHLQKQVKEIGEHKGSHYIGMKVKNPLTGQEVPVYSGEFVMADEGTGIVMSVPAHDPFDYFYVKKIDKKMKLPQVIEVDGVKGLLIDSLIEKYEKEKAVVDLDALNRIKEKVYLEELNRGRILASIPEIGGMRVEDAKKSIIRLMEKKGICDKIYDLSVKPIFCRCGAEVVVRAVKGQWFIDYGNPEWKALAKKCVERMSTYPPEYKKELPSIIDWLDIRPCVRKRGFGTKFPFDESWIIEALSDSTIYMAFYMVSKYVNEGRISPEQLNDSFFDFIFLGIGYAPEVAKESKISQETLSAIRKEFLEKYPLDLNVGGVEHKSVHFPFFIFTHVAIFPEELWPKAVFLNWHVIAEGQKMSKHLGNTVYWDQAVSSLGVDAIRLYAASGTSQWSQFDWKGEEADRCKRQLQEFKATTERRLSAKESKENEIIDQWLESKLNSRMDGITGYMESYEIRKAIQAIFYEMNNDMTWYENRGGSNSGLMQRFILNQLKMLYPFVPETSAALMKLAGKDSIKEGWPVADRKAINKKTEDIENSVVKTMEDIRNITKLVKGGKALYLYVTTEEEKKAYNECAEMTRSNSGMDELHVFRISDPKIDDPTGKAKKAKYLRPAIYIATG